MRIVRAIVIGFSLVLILCSGLANERAVKASSPASPSLNVEIIGTWRLDSRTVKQADGSESSGPPGAPKTIGYLSYDNVGHMSIQQMKPNRPKNDGGEGYEAYFGTYTVDEQNKTVTHHIEAALALERVGTDFQTNIEVKGNELMLITHEPQSVIVVKHYTRIQVK